MSFGYRNTVRRYPDEYLKKDQGIKTLLKYSEINSVNSDDVEPEIEDIYKRNVEGYQKYKNPLRKTTRVGGKRRRHRQTKRRRSRQTKRRRSRN